MTMVMHKEITELIGRTPLVRLNRFSKPAKNLIQNRTVKRLFVFEVVIKPCLIDLGGASDCVGPRAGDALVRKCLYCRLKNGGSALLGLAAGTELGFCWSGSHVN